MISQQQSGLSDVLTPGDLSSLSQGSTTRFRVISDENIQSQYYRVYVLEDYDGIQWQLSTDSRPALYGDIRPTKLVQIDMEPHNQRWLPTPEWAILDTQQLSITHTQATLEPLQDFWRKSFSVSEQTSVTHSELSSSERKRLTFIPDDTNPRTQAMLEPWRGLSLPRVISHLEQMITQSHIYTLKPPKTTSSDLVDFLLFDSQQGYCGHYANAVAFTLRALDFPSRVVIGFQGGEYNALGNYTQVGDADAHAWVEVFDQGRWVRIDPTVWLAPSRLSMSANLLRQSLFSGIDAQSQIDQSALLREASKSAWRYMRHFFDNVQRTYTLWVIEFDRDKQTELLNKITAWLWLPALLLIIVGVVYWRRQHQHDKALVKLDNWLKQRGVVRESYQTPMYWTNEYPELTQFAQVWLQSRYGSETLSDNVIIQYLPK